LTIRSGPSDAQVRGTCLLPGDAEGDLLWLDEPISFWGGIDPATGNIVDVHHPQLGACIRDRVIALPGTRGSTAGPGALLEAILAGNGPRAIILTMPDTACVVAILASQPLLASGLPVLAIDSAVACRLRVKPRWHVSGASAWPVTQDAPVDQ
jgi:predicted aconitase with swiveling domain